MRVMAGGAEGLIQTDPSRRPTDARWAVDQEVAFADGYPALIASEVCGCVCVCVCVRVLDSLCLHAASYICMIAYPFLGIICGILNLLLKICMFIPHCQIKC